MENFAIKIDDKLKQNLYKICRLCGIDKSDMCKILPEHEDINETNNIDADDIQLSQKIYELIGVMVTEDDEMPQTMCSLCLEKITDFYEFREMCLATNDQTRKLLGVKSVQILKNKIEMEIKPDIWADREYATLNLNNNRKRKSSEDLTYKQENLTPLECNMINKKLCLPTDFLRETAKKKAKKREFPNSDYHLTDIQRKIQNEIKNKYYMKNKVHNSIGPLGKIKESCNICNEGFLRKGKLETHLRYIHLPRVERFVCTTCNEVIKKCFDIKNHQLWHRLSGTPYKCPVCKNKTYNLHAYGKHVRTHDFTSPSHLWISDRVCPKCHVTYPTHFLYNIHPCAIETGRCAGCNCVLNSKIEYLQHSANCPKTYLTYSEHILTEVTVTVTDESVQIKNENDVEAAAEELCKQSGLSFDMNPIVRLSRLSSIDDDPTAKVVVTDDCTKKVHKNRISKKDYKRVDKLLKSTLDTLVSIKQEPEVNVSLEVPTMNSLEICSTNDNEDSISSIGSLYDVNNKSNDDSDNNNDEVELVVKKEKEDHNGSINHITNYDNNDSCSNKMPLLKLKIKKEHGQLNSSLLINEDKEEICHKCNKKKKRNNDQVGENNTNTEMSKSLNEDTNVSFNTIPHNIEDIQSEIIQNDDMNAVVNKIQPSATIMTSIPMMQLKIGEVSEAVDFTNSMYSNKNQIDCNEVLEDIKPNPIELDHLLKMSEASGDVKMPQRDTEDLFDNVANVNVHVNDIQCSMEKSIVNQTASKSTSVKRINNYTDINLLSSPSIESVQSSISMSGLSSDSSIYVKPEPITCGYADEDLNKKITKENVTLECTVNKIYSDESCNVTNSNQTMQHTEEHNNLCNRQIKEEQDLDINDVQWTQIDNDLPFDSMNSVRGDNNSDSNIESRDLDDDDEEDDDILDAEINEEEREYRELELPPELQNSRITDEDPQQFRNCDEQNKDNDLSLACNTNMENGTEPIKETSTKSFKITAVCSEVEQQVQQFPKQKSNETKLHEFTNENFESKADVNDQSNGPLNTTNDKDSEKNMNLITKIMADIDSDDFTDSKKCLTTCKSISNEMIYQKAEQDLQARPYFNMERDDNIGNNFSIPSNHVADFNTEEEQQNQRNHDLVEQRQQEQQQSLFQSLDETFVTAQAFLENVSCNSINQEQQQQQLPSSSPPPPQQQQQQSEFHGGHENTLNTINSCDLQAQLNELQIPPFEIPFNFDNINEIAENNNNANIERELQVGEQLRQQEHSQEIPNSANDDNENTIT